MINPDLEHLRKVGSPLRLAQTLAPHLYGPRSTYQADPWLRMCEGRIMDAISDRENQRFLKINAPPQSGKAAWSSCSLLSGCSAIGLIPESS